MALVLLIDPTGMILTSAQESPHIRENVNGGEAKEQSDNGAFAALLFSVIAVPQMGGGMPSTEAAQGNALEGAAPGVSENNPATQSSSAGAEGSSFSSASSTLDAGQMASVPENSQQSSLPPKLFDRVAVSPHPGANEEAIQLDAAGGTASLGHQLKREFTGEKTKLVAAAAELQPKGPSEIGDMKEGAPNSKPDQSRVSAHDSIQAQTAEAVETSPANTAPAHGSADHKSFDREAQPFSNPPEQKTPLIKETGVTGGFSLEPTVHHDLRTQGEAEPVAWRSTVERLAGDIVSRVRIGAREAILQLDPPELGKIKIDLRMDGDKLLARIAAESPEAQSLLKNHLPELHQALQSQQVNLAEVRVWHAGNGSAAGDFAQNFQQAPGQNDRGGWLGGGAHDERDHEGPKPEHFATGSGRVSLWV